MLDSLQCSWDSLSPPLKDDGESHAESDEPGQGKQGLYTSHQVERANSDVGKDENGDEQEAAREASGRHREQLISKANVGLGFVRGESSAIRLACVLAAVRMLGSRNRCVLYSLTAREFVVLQSKDPTPSHV
jgi:hypothetical protein